MGLTNRLITPNNAATAAIVSTSPPVVEASTSTPSMTNVATHSATALTRSRTMNPTAPERSGHRPGRSCNLAIYREMRSSSGLTVAGTSIT